MKPCVIFDLDGTLVDSLPGIAASLNRSLSAHALPEHPQAAIRGFVGDGLHSLVQRAAPADTDAAGINSLIGVFKADYALTWADGTKIYPGIVGLLHELVKSGFQLAVLSNKNHAFTVEMVRGLFPEIHFAAVLGQRDGSPHKPHPAGALQIAGTLGAAPDDCVVIGDSTIDIETATNAGMKAIGVSWGYHERTRLLASGAETIIDQPSELPALLALD